MALLAGPFSSIACGSNRDDDSPAKAGAAGANAAAARSGTDMAGSPGNGSSAGSAGNGGAGNAGAGNDSGGGGAGAGCSGDGSAGAAPHFPRDVEAAIQAKCQRCHQQPPQNGAPFPLLTWEDTQAPYGLQLVYQAMLPAIEKGFMPFTELRLDPPVEPLSVDEKTRLLDWLRDGAQPSFDAACD